MSVAAVLENGPAAAAGLLKGDHLAEIDGVKIESVVDVRRTTARTLPGKELRLRIRRGDEERELKITAGNGL